MTDWLPNPDNEPDDLNHKDPALVIYTPGEAHAPTGAHLDNDDEEPTEDLGPPITIDDPANHHWLPKLHLHLPLPHTPTRGATASQLVASLTAPWPVAARWAGAVVRWQLPGGQATWWPVLWAWRWRKTAALVAVLAVLTGEVTVRNIVLLAGAWLAAAMAINAPAASRLRLASLQRMSAYRKRRRRLRARRVRKMWANAGLVRASKERGEPKRYPKIRRRRPHPLGVVVRVDASGPGYHVDDFQAAAGTIAASLKARAVKVRRVERWWHRGDILLTITWADPFPKVITTVDLAVAVGGVRARWERREWWRTHVVPWLFNPLPRVLESRAVPVGVNDERLPVAVQVRRPLLVAAVSGAGKSSLVWSLLWGLRRLWVEEGLPTLVSVFDPKRQEFPRLRGKAWRYVNSNAGWIDFLRWESAALEADQERAEVEGFQDVPWDGVHAFRLLVVDELITALMSKGQESKLVAFGQERTARDAFTVLMSQMRAANRSMVASTQELREAVLGTAREQFPYTAVGIQPQTGKSTIDIAFGTGGHEAYPAHRLDLEVPAHLGRFYMRSEGSVEYLRAAKLTDREMDVTAAWVGEMTEMFRARGVVDPTPAARPARGGARAGGAGSSVARPRKSTGSRKASGPAARRGERGGAEEGAA
jgi:hypothetical protein